MSDTLPALTHPYNLARLGHAGDEVRFEADPDQRAAIAKLSAALGVERFAVTVALKKASPSRFTLDYRVEAEVTQACVVTLEPVAARIDHRFTRELHFAGPKRPSPESTELDFSALEEDEPEEIESLHYDLAAPALEEYLLALDPYPRAPGVEFSPEEAGILPPESPFAVLKTLKSPP